MKHLEIFENDNSEFDVTEDDIIDIFNDFEDEGYKIVVRFGKRLHQFNEIDTDVTNQNIKMGFKLSIWVYLTSSYMDSTVFSRSEKYINLMEEIKYRLNTLNLYIKEVDKSKNQINILIYTK